MPHLLVNPGEISLRRAKFIRRLMGENPGAFHKGRSTILGMYGNRRHLNLLVNHFASYYASFSDGCQWGKRGEKNIFKFFSSSKFLVERRRHSSYAKFRPNRCGYDAALLEFSSFLRGYAAFGCLRASRSGCPTRFGRSYVLSSRRNLDFA